MRKYMQEGKRPLNVNTVGKLKIWVKIRISDRVFKTEIFKDEDIRKSAEMSLG